MQAGSRPAQLGARAPSNKCVEDELQSGQSIIIPIQSRGLYHGPILILKCFRLVVFTLIDDIVNDDILFTLTARECAVLFTPSAELREKSLLPGPLAAALFDITHKITQRHCGGKLNKHVNVIAYAINAIETATTALDNRPNISIKMFTGFIGYGHLTSIGVDDNMKYGTDCTHSSTWCEGWNCKVKIFVFPMQVQQV